MEKKFSFLERITSDTPTFFKQVQSFGLGLATLGTGLAQIQGIPNNLIAGLISAGTAIAAIAQFAVKEYEPDKPQNDEAK
jgi:hypothetical protein